MTYSTKSCMILLSICVIIISNSKALPDSTEIITEGVNNSNFYYKDDFLNKKIIEEDIVQRKSKILKQNFVDTVPITKNSIVEDLVKFLTVLQYQPVVVLIDDNCNALLNANYIMSNLLNMSNIRNEFWLMKFNKSGVTNVLVRSRTSYESFKKSMNEITLANTMSDGNGSATFFAILKATQILPKNSVILIFSENKPIDEDLSQLALQNLIQKQIRLFVVWNSLQNLQGQAKLLKETAIYSSGTFYFQNLNLNTNCKKLQISEFNDNNNIHINKKELLLVKRVVHDEKIKIPIDYTIKSLEIIIEGNFQSAILISPAGYTANLLDLMSMRGLSPSSSIAHALGSWAHVRFDMLKVNPKPVNGIWELNINKFTNDTSGSNVTIYAETDLIVTSEFIKNGQSGSMYSSRPKNENEIKLNINGDILKIENISILDNTGHEIRKMPSNYLKNMKIIDEKNVESYSLKFSGDNMTLPTNPLYVKITGSTKQGEKFSRISYVELNRDTRHLPIILIESSIRSNLIATAGSNPKVIFEVTNNDNYPNFVRFSVRDDKSMLRDLVPKGTVIPSKGSAEVTVYTIIPPTSTMQYTDIITLTAYGNERAQKSATLYVNSASAKSLDTTLPYLNYRFTSNCMEVSYSSCQSSIWSIEVTAQDSESGLLRVVSEPAGLYSPNGYISGTRETVTLYYTSNCCQPNIVITAIDLNNNKRSYSADAYHANLSTGSIIAIVLGVILLIIIIIIIVLLLRKYCKQRDSLDLPRYRSQLASSRF